MPKKDSILNLPGFVLKQASHHPHLIMDVVYRGSVACIHCGHKRLRKKDSFIRSVRHEQFGLRRTVLRFKAYKFHCLSCKRYFNQRFPGILKYQRATAKLHEQIFYQHTQGISQKALARDFKLGKSTVERWYHEYYVHLNQHLKQRSCPSVLGIDEHSFNKKTGYATTFCDLRTHRIFDVVKGRSEKDLAAYLHQLPGKERVKVVCIDLSSSYRSVIKRYFPNAKIVADRFHVIRLLNQMCMQVYHAIDPDLKYKRGLLAALKTNPENLTRQRELRRNQYLKDKPAIEAVYQFKQRLHQLLMHKHQKAKHCKKLLPIFLNFIHELKTNAFKPLITLGKTLYHWREEIVRMWRFTKNNGITEGFHRKMKLIQRRAYGFRNFENYRLRVKVLCS